MRQFTKEQRERIRRCANKWYLENKHDPALKEARKKRLWEWRKENHPHYLWQGAKMRSKQLSLPFNISKEDIIIPDKCPALNVPFEFGTPYAASLDKIDSNLGYVKGNIQVISRKANRMKQDATKEELKNFAKWINQSIL